MQHETGEKFSRYTHGMFLYPKPTINKIIAEDTTRTSLLVSFFVVVVAGIMTDIGLHLWNVLFPASFLTQLVSMIWFWIGILAYPILFIIKWIVWALILHFIASVMSGRDITNRDIAHRTLKLVGLSMVPAFLNIIPFFNLISGYWITLLCFWSVKANYHLHKKAALVVIAPMLFATLYLSILGILNLL